MKVEFDQVVFKSELDRMLSRKYVIMISLVFAFVSAIATYAIAYYHDTYRPILEPREIAIIDVWFRVSLSILTSAFAVLIIYPLGSAAMSCLYAITPKRAKSIKERIDKEMGTKIPIEIDKIALRKLFSDSFPDEKFSSFCEVLKECSKDVCKREYGKLAEIIMFHSPYCSINDKYKKTVKGKQEWNFTPFCADFYSALGINKPSTCDRSYYDNTQEDIIKKYRSIIDYDRNT